MHELGIATGIVDVLRQAVPPGREAAVRRVRVRVGDLSGVAADALAFCFAAVVEGSEFGAAVLEIDRVPTRGECKDCGAGIEMDQPTFWCPNCRSPRVQLTSGRELQVADVELDDEAELTLRPYARP